MSYRCTVNETSTASRTVTVHRIPINELLQRMAGRYSSLDPTAIEAYLTLLGVAGEVVAATAANLVRHGLGGRRFLVLGLLLEHQPKLLSHSELAELSGFNRGNVTGLVDGLERDGYVKREDSGDDRRVTRIALTLIGRRLIETVLPDQFGRIAGLMGELSASECKTLVSLLTKVTKVQIGMAASKCD